MKIKFIKEYRAYRWLDGSLETYDVYKSGKTEKVSEDEAQWLIDNGFAEKVEERWPVCGDKYWCVDTNGIVKCSIWDDSSFSCSLKAIGNVFKTEESAQRFADHLLAVEAVRHDEGFMKPMFDVNGATFGYGILATYDGEIVATPLARSVHAGEFYFDTKEHAQASLDENRDEWRTILNYDWSKE